MDGTLLYALAYGQGDTGDADLGRPRGNADTGRSRLYACRRAAQRRHAALPGRYPTGVHRDRREWGVAQDLFVKRLPDRARGPGHVRGHVQPPPHVVAGRHEAALHLQSQWQGTPSGPNGRTASVPPRCSSREIGPSSKHCGLPMDSGSSTVRTTMPASDAATSWRSDLGTTAIPVTFVATTAEETGPSLSHDGRWLAYAADETGRKEIYVRPFPNTEDGKWLVSTNGGIEPAWAHSGRELFYRDGSGNVVAVTFTSTGTTFEVRQRPRAVSGTDVLDQRRSPLVRRRTRRSAVHHDRSRLHRHVR